MFKIAFHRVCTKVRPRFSTVPVGIEIKSQRGADVVGWATLYRCPGPVVRPGSAEYMRVAQPLRCAKASQLRRQQWQ